jgi:hypothetical protein
MALFFLTHNVSYMYYSQFFICPSETLLILVLKFLNFLRYFPSYLEPPYIWACIIIVQSTSVD